MPAVSLVIGHGGHATTVRALAHDLPLVVLPMHPMLGQKMIGDSVAARGAGVVLSPRSPAAQIAAAASTLPGPGPHTGAAASIGAALRAEDGAARAADRLTTLLSTAPGTADGRASHPIVGGATRDVAHSPGSGTKAP